MNAHQPSSGTDTISAPAGSAAARQASGRAAHGLIVGKFYPPHAGHHYLIDTAAAVCDHLSVLVAAASTETGLSADQRVAILTEVHAHQANVRIVGCVDDVPTDYDDPGIWDAHLAAWAPALETETADWGPFDAVFSSEGYGRELATRLSATAVTVDAARVAFPLSGSEIRADVLGHWEQLRTPTQAALARKVVVVGAESTGTTTLSRALAAALSERGGPLGATRWVGEAGRDYTWVKLAAARAGAALSGAPTPGMADLVWDDDDLAACAWAQTDAIETATAAGAAVVIADTDALATTCWARRYLGHVPDQVTAAAERTAVDLYLVTDHQGVPFVQDGIRDGEHIRAQMTSWFIDAVTASGAPYVVLTGNASERLESALAAVDRLLADGWRFAQPGEYLHLPDQRNDRLRWLINRLGLARSATALGVGSADLRAAAARCGDVTVDDSRLEGLTQVVAHLEQVWDRSLCGAWFDGTGPDGSPLALAAAGRFDELHAIIDAQMAGSYD